VENLWTVEEDVVLRLLVYLEMGGQNSKKLTYDQIAAAMAEEASKRRISSCNRPEGATLRLRLYEDKLLAKRAICWISHAQRPLTTKELCCALAIEPGDKTLNTDNFYEVEDIISVCAGLITVDEESRIIRLVHYTTQEHFESMRQDWNPGAQEEIAVACLTYLSFDALQSGSCTNDRSFKQRLAKN
jgi:hypothetical protein